jgi:ADP-heptose:LPS heptosyltransferase
MPNRRWPTSNFVAAIEHLSKRGLVAVIVEDIGERAIADEITRACTAVDLVGRLSLGELTAVIERCSLYLGNNTGPIHIAAAVGAPIVGIYGRQPVTDRLWTPPAERSRIVLPTNPCACFDPATCRQAIRIVVSAFGPSPCRRSCKGLIRCWIVLQRTRTDANSTSYLLHRPTAQPLCGAVGGDRFQVGGTLHPEPSGNLT